MVVLHIGFLSHYTDGMIYQDNSLAEMNVSAGHDVVYITDTYKYENGKLVKTNEEDIILSNGIRLIRLEYDNLLISFLTNKIQKVHKLVPLLYEIKPDAILYHGACGYELVDVAKYIESHSDVAFYIDSHADFNNTAKTKLSRFAYKCIHGMFINKARKYVKKVLYITTEAREYLKEMYSFEDSELEFFPLGGIIQTEKKRLDARNVLLKRYNWSSESIICAHSGKLDELKRTRELITAFKSVRDNRMRLLIFGVIPDVQKKILEPLIESDDRIIFLGWKSGKESIEILSGVDLYCQPGSQSITSQTALCCGCAEMLYPHPSYKNFYGDIAFYVENENDMKKIFHEICTQKELLCELQSKSKAFAEENLSYKKMAERYLF